MFGQCRDGGGEYFMNREWDGLRNPPRAKGAAPARKRGPLGRIGSIIVRLVLAFIAFAVSIAASEIGSGTIVANSTGTTDLGAVDPRGVAPALRVVHVEIAHGAVR